MALASPPLVRLARLPFHPALVSAAATCFIGTLLTDLAYWRTANILWMEFSTWLVTAGFVLALVALATAAFDHLDGRLPQVAAMWPYLVGLVSVLVLAFFDVLIHTRDAWTSVVPWGLALSVIVVLLVLATGFMGRLVLSGPDAGGTL
jgi:uncharacterized membrane protein